MEDGRERERERERDTASPHIPNELIKRYPPPSYFGTSRKHDGKVLIVSNNHRTCNLFVALVLAFDVHRTCWRSIEKNSASSSWPRGKTKRTRNGRGASKLLWGLGGGVAVGSEKNAYAFRATLCVFFASSVAPTHWTPSGQCIAFTACFLYLPLPPVPFLFTYTYKQQEMPHA